MNPEVEEILKHFNRGFNQKVYDYATNVILKDSKYIVVQSRGRQQYGYCTSCNEWFPTHIPKPTEAEIADRIMCGCHAAYWLDEEYEKKKHGKKMVCPKCRFTCTVRYAGAGHSHLIDNGYFVYYEKSKINPQMIVATGFYCQRNYSETYEDVKTCLSPDAYYIFEYKNRGYMIDYYHYLNTVSKTVSSKMDKFGYKTEVGCCIESIAEAVKGTPFAWSGWNLYKNGGDYVKYFDLFSRYPAVEYLMKLGHKAIIEEKLNIGSISQGVINWRGKDLLSVLKLTKAEYTAIRKNKIEITSRLLIFIKENRKQGWGLTIPELKTLSKMAVRGISDIVDIIEKFGKYMSTTEALKYCIKQRAKHEMYSLWMIGHDWEDYIRECRQLHISVKDKWVRFPNDLYAAHQKTLMQIEFEKNKALNKAVEARLEDLNQYRYENDAFLIRPAESATEIVAEGKALSHCVGQYAKRHADGELSIFFIRKTSEPDKPYYTLELIKDRIVQVRGSHNCATTPEIDEFLKSWTKEKLAKNFKKKKANTRVKLTVPA
jgi:hypothetical protein